MSTNLFLYLVIFFSNHVHSSVYTCISTLQCYIGIVTNAGTTATFHHHHYQSNIITITTITIAISLQSPPLPDQYHYNHPHYHSDGRTTDWLDWLDDEAASV